ncbi:MAG: RelA/SpoT family protein [Bacillota bacterium]
MVLKSNGLINTSLIERAYRFAEQAHHGQQRDSGEDFIQHPMAVAVILAEMEMDQETIAAGLLHDVPEDTQITVEQVRREFGDNIARLVDGVTKLGRIAVSSKEEQQVENYRKMFLAMAQDFRVILIKLADRLHNLRTLKHITPERQQETARETLEIYAPLAHRLGIWKIKWELEDLALRYIAPQAYYDLVQKVAAKRKEREGWLEEIKDSLSEHLKEIGIKGEIQGRPKHFYSIYQKMKEQGKEFFQIYDLLGIRVIVDNIKDCYGVLGIVHTLWKPMPGRFKDYIAMPKSNMYQSLHTTIIGPFGEPLEIQIRTRDMHRTAEFGLAAHWKYKEGKAMPQDYEEKIAWLRNLLEWQKDVDAKEYMEHLKIDLFTDEVFVFTPKGDVINLPLNATPVDMAFAIHTQLGYRCIGAKVNSKIVNLDYKLKNGDIVEIMTSKVENGPRQDWLTFVKTAKAKNRIRAWLKENQREQNLNLGKELLEKELRKQGQEVHEHMKGEVLAEVAKKLGFANKEDLLVAVGYNKLSPGIVIGKIISDKEEEEKPQVKKAAAQPRPRKAQRGVRIKGVDNLLVKFSRCCSPVPGDSIVGYITRGRGVSVHRKDCQNVQLLGAQEEARQVEVEWDQGDTGGNVYPVELRVEAIDRINLLANIMSAISDMKLNIFSMNVRTAKNSQSARINMIIETNNLEQIRVLTQRIRNVEGVTDVYRYGVAREAPR